MNNPRRTKKSETLEVRLSYEAKHAFMARCRAEGRTASEVVRGLIEVEPLARSARSPVRARYLIAAGAAAAALAAAAAPSLARPASSARLEALDLNRDGVVSAAEFQRLDLDRDGRVSVRELTEAAAASDRP